MVSSKEFRYNITFLCPYVHDDNKKVSIEAEFNNDLENQYPISLKCYGKKSCEAKTIGKVIHPDGKAGIGTSINNKNCYFYNNWQSFDIPELTKK
jgi:hypothetical protein